MALDYLSFDDRLELGLASIDDMPEEQTSMLDIAVEKDEVVSEDYETTIQSTVIEEKPVANTTTTKSKHKDQSAPMCYNCGNQTQKSGSCYVCSSCGSTTGCSWEALFKLI